MTTRNLVRVEELLDHYIFADVRKLLEEQWQGGTVCEYPMAIAKFSGHETHVIDGKKVGYVEYYLLAISAEDKCGTAVIHSQFGCDVCDIPLSTIPANWHITFTPMDYNSLMTSINEAGPLTGEDESPEIGEQSDARL